MAKAVDKIHRINESAAQLAALIQGERVYLPHEVPKGYAGVDEVAAQSSSLSTQMAGKRLLDLWRAGKASRIAVKVGQRRSYWYRQANQTSKNAKKRR